MSDDTVIIEVVYIDRYPIPTRHVEITYRLNPADIGPVIAHLVNRYGTDLVQINEVCLPGIRVDDNGLVWMGGRSAARIFAGGAYVINATDSLNVESVRTFCHRWCLDPTTILPNLPKMVESND